MPLPLAGVTVVSLEQAVAAPFATRQLADLGARVIKIERPGDGDFARRYDDSVYGQSSYFVWLNRSKESVTLDLKHDQGREILHQLLARADVFVQNLAPGAAARLGCDAASLTAGNSGLIVCDISGFGADGPWSHRKAYDLLVQFESGLVSLTGSADQVAKVGISVADIAAGMYAYSGILAALYSRATTGTASTVRVSLFDALAEWMAQPAYYTKYGGRQPERVGAAHATIAPYGPYTAGDGVTVLLAIQHEREWRSFCALVLGLPELIDDPRLRDNASRVAHRALLDSLIAERLAAMDSGTLRGKLDAAGIANSGLNTVADFLRHPVLTGRDRWRTVATPAGEVESLLPPVTMGGVDPRLDPVPAVGEHTDLVLTELGHTADQIAALRSAAAI